MGALSKSSSMVDSPTVWELPDARLSLGGLGLRKVENMKTGRMSLEAREDREDGYSPNSQRRAAIEFRARKGWRVVRIYGEERRSSSLDSSTVRRTLKQVADNAGDPKANVGITRSLLPKDFADRLDRLREASGLTWSGFAKALDVDYKQMLRWRKGVEPSGGAMHSLFLFAGRLPGGLAILMGDGFQMTFFKD